MVTSAYIHIPFCKSKCKYCSFVSFTDRNKFSDYFSALLKDIDFNYKGECLSTLYFGGGTPSLISADLIEKVINKFNFSSECEITFEINPDDANFDYLKSLFEIGINRISMGSQSFDDGILELIGRRHNSKDVMNAVETAQKVGFKNISLDLIYGLPNQTIDLIKKDLETITSLKIQHISTYGLKIEDNSFWGKQTPSNLPDDDTQADMYLFINNSLENKGYKRYEVSNFALKGYESKHNLNYWNNAEYYGFGVSAHGYCNNIRYSNFCTLEKYLENPTKHDKEQVLTNLEKLEEEIFLGFRKTEGVNVEKINNKFNIDFDKKYQKTLEKYIPEFIEQTQKGYKLTLEGTLLSNIILAEFIDSV